MKKIISLLVVMVAASSIASAQIAPQGSSYKELKNYYSAKDYVKSDADPYSVFWTGLESLATPGIPHLIMKETGRGWSFIGAAVVIDIFGQSAVNKLIKQVEYKDGELVKDANGSIVFNDEEKAKQAVGMMFGAIVADLALRIWATVDGVKVAKVKNQYFQDLQGKKAFSANLYPSVNFAQSANGLAAAPGMTFALTF